MLGNRTYNINIYIKIVMFKYNKINLKHNINQYNILTIYIKNPNYFLYKHNKDCIWINLFRIFNKGPGSSFIKITTF